MAAYYQYIPKNEEKAWQMPNFEIGMDAAYTLQEKYTLRLSLLALGSKYARTIEGSQVVPAKMSGAFDLGAGFEYQINKMISAYVDANNLLNQHYQRWYQYPVQGILVMAGVKLSF
jgi:outer membrane cobalamin receptor